jgi:phosphatidylglycerol:prolipoprotein diacylglycerol transferase
VLVLTGCFVGLLVARHRAAKLGLDLRAIVDGAIWTVGAGFVFGHVVDVLAYSPERLAADGAWPLVRLWEGFSSFGGFLGAAAGSVAYFALVRKLDYFRYADVLAYGFPFGWFFGRVGCAVVHDHIGRPTDFFLGVDFSGAGDPLLRGVRHELGLDEAAFTLVLCALFAALGRKDRVPGFFLGLFAVVYAPVRFGLDFLRSTDLPDSDPRYGGLTPGQYFAFALALAGAAILATRDWRGFRPRPLVAGPATHVT